ncbi:hypothetical protein K435DRAFT_801852 [Dendrothele bispora CBS 962.96]|uniref:Uncharacterized protein n=1 Tax=Dendrothele bispora (strain CBS 962.96) TaxID=1314807 RepID=A0A4S8LPE4_DENBC|nr:hypothetical protein K435DRAFT_801852 [Dendrothele bispora CBS 962.96]
MPDPDLKGRVKGQGFEIFGGLGPTWFRPGWPSCWYTVPFQAILLSMAITNSRTWSDPGPAQEVQVPLVQGQGPAKRWTEPPGPGQGPKNFAQAPDLAQTGHWQDWIQSPFSTRPYGKA